MISLHDTVPPPPDDDDVGGVTVRVCVHELAVVVAPFTKQLAVYVPTLHRVTDPLGVLSVFTIFPALSRTSILNVVALFPVHVSVEVRLFLPVEGEAVRFKHTFPASSSVIVSGS